MTVGFESVSQAMAGLGFSRKGRHVVHPESDFYVGLPSPPLTVGEEAPREAREYVLGIPGGAEGKARILEEGRE